MDKQITISKKTTPKGDDGHRVVSVRMGLSLIDALDTLSEQSNRSRNEIINILLEEAIQVVEIQ